tara:strand:- start:1840 stop:2241 length:402 start_codon:yes stop_codon:yes gene_type:complete
MAVKFDVALGGFVQDTDVGASSIEFRVKGPIENPNLEVIAAPTYTSSGFEITTATLSVLEGQAGSFTIEVRSADADGTNEVTHVSETVTIGGTGAYGELLTISNSNIGSDKVVKLFTEYVSGSISSDISVTLE